MVRVFAIEVGQPRTSLSSAAHSPTQLSEFTARFFGNAWLYLGRKDATLIDAMMAQMLSAERQGLTSAQLPAKDSEPLKAREEYWQWRERVGAVPPKPAGGK